MTDGSDGELHHGPMMQAEQDPSKNDYATPPEVWRRLADPIDGFDLDPCSGAESTPIAPERYTKEDDGLRQPWHGDVFVNPPWSSDGDASAKEQWLSKCRAETNRDEVDSVVVLLPSDTSAGWFHEHVLAAELVCFYGPGRLSFEGGGKNPSFGLIIAVYGRQADAYRDVLSGFGIVVEGRKVYERTHQSRLVTDGGQPADGVAQAGLSSWSRLQVVEPADRTHGDRSIRCPDCGHTVSETHGGQPLPEDLDFERTFGWRCSDCHNVLPSRAFNPEADTFNEKYRGAEVAFRDGSSRFIPVPADEVDR